MALNRKEKIDKMELRIFADWVTMAKTKREDTRGKYLQYTSTNQ